MVKIDALLFGYRRLNIAPDNLSTLTSILLRASIPSVINNDGTVIVRERDFKKIQNLISGRIEFNSSNPLGIYGWVKRLNHKPAIIISLFFSIILMLILSNLVWDIRVEGNESVTDTEVILSLAECGFEIGDFWSRVDRSSIENAFLNKKKNISWININRRGSVAYVKVMERETNEENAVQYDDEPSNLVALADCVIEEITVKRGKAVVKAGDTVKKGDLLVIGAFPAESGGEFCRAEATVIGRLSDRVSVELSREYDKKTDSDKKLYSCTLKIFKISLNIFKRYGNLTNEYVIIDNEIKYSLFDRHPLPLSVCCTYVTDYKVEKALYTDEELVKIASERLMALTASRLESADLLKIKTSGDFTDEGYCISSDILYLAEVAERVKLDIQK